MKKFKNGVYYHPQIDKLILLTICDEFSARIEVGSDYISAPLELFLPINAINKQIIYIGEL